MPTRKLISDAARAMNAKRKTRRGGRPPKLVPCPDCGQPITTRTLLRAEDRAKHAPDCQPKRV